MGANNIDLSAGRKVSINLSAPGSQSMELGGSGTKDHSKLKHLGFDESGHTGFQKELTPEQLSKIAAIPDWNQNDETQPDYIKGRTHYIKRTEVGITLVANEPYEVEDGWICGEYSASSSVDLSEIRTVYIDGVECVAESGSLATPSGDSVSWGPTEFDEEGNPITWGYITFGTLEPEAVQYPDIYIYWYEYEVIPLDDKFIPDTIARTSTVNEALQGVERTSNKALDWGEENISDEKYPNMELTHLRFVDVEELINYVSWDMYGEDGLRAMLEVHKEDIVNKTTDITIDSTDEQYPSAKAVYDKIKNTKDYVNSSIQQAILDSWAEVIEP